MPEAVETIRVADLRPYVCRVRVEGETLRGRLRLEGILEEFPGIGEVRFRVIRGPWEGASWIRDAGGLFWRIKRPYPLREEIADLSPQVARGVRLEDLTWSVLLSRVRKWENPEILRADKAILRLRHREGGWTDEVALDARSSSPLSWTRWEDDEMVLRVFYDPVKEESAGRVIAWAALGVAVGVASLGIWLWKRGTGNHEDEP